MHLPQARFDGVGDHRHLRHVGSTADDPLLQPEQRVLERSDDLVEGRPLMLGGVRIEHSLGLLGHSDADVLLHAITDALLGAAALSKHSTTTFFYV